MGNTGSKKGVSSTDIIQIISTITTIHDNVTYHQLQKENARKVILYHLIQLEKHRMHPERPQQYTIFENNDNIIKIIEKYHDSDQRTAWSIALELRPGTQIYKVLHGIPSNQNDEISQGLNDKPVNNRNDIPTSQVYRLSAKYTQSEHTPSMGRTSASNDITQDTGMRRDNFAKSARSTQTTSINTSVNNQTTSGRTPITQTQANRNSNILSTPQSNGLSPTAQSNGLSRSRSYEQLYTQQTSKTPTAPRSMGLQNPQNAQNPQINANQGNRSRNAMNMLDDMNSAKNNVTTKADIGLQDINEINLSRYN